MKVIVCFAEPELQVRLVGIEDVEALDGKSIRALLRKDGKEKGSRLILDCITRSIEGVDYDIWVDDEELLKNDEHTVMGVLDDASATEVICGKCLIANSDADGNVVGLSDEDVGRIIRSFVRVSEHWSDHECEFGKLLFPKKGDFLLIYGMPSFAKAKKGAQA